jgi:ADP-ribosyl-[dinitrogen reductase] hydrolase
MKNKELIRSILFGVCVGDSIGLHVQFKERYEVKQKPVTDLQGYGTFNLPPELASRGEI